MIPNWLARTATSTPIVIRNWSARTAIAAGIFFVSLAQAEASPPPVLAQLKVTQANAKNYIVESLVTVALMGGALFIVCKTSRRS
jgi:hypothetical protein